MAIESMTWRQIKDRNPLELTSTELQIMSQYLHNSLQTGMFRAGETAQVVSMYKALQFEYQRRQEEYKNNTQNLEEEYDKAMQKWARECGSCACRYCVKPPADDQEISDASLQYYIESWR